MPWSPTLLHVLFLGMGVASSGQILTFSVLKQYNPLDRASTVIAFVNMAVVAGGFVFQPLVGKWLQILWDGRMKAGVPLYHINHFQLVLSVVPMCFFICMIIAFSTLDPDS